MFKKILLASDLSPAAEQIIGAVGSLHRLGTEEVVLVHCLNIRDVGTLSDILTRLLQPELAKQAEKLQKLGFAVKSEIRFGLPALEINRAAQENDCAIIVLGSHGYSLPKEILLGGVATSVLHTATRPVLIIKITSPTPLTAWNPLTHILYPTDFSDNAEAAFTYLKVIVSCGAEKVTLLHIQDQIIGKHLAERLAEFNKIDEGRLLRLRDELQSKSKVEVKIEIPFGLVAQEIINRIKTDKVSLVVMGTQGRGHIGEVFLGSVSNKVVRYSPVPVLLVPLVHS
jgi:nucleotide-binding universal stress UspA family protein